MISIKEKPIIGYIIENYLWNDFKEFVFVIGHKGKMMQKNLEQKQKKYRKKYPDKDFNFHYVINKHVSRGNGYSGLLGLRKVFEENLGTRIILSMGDHLYSYRLINLICKEGINDADIIIATDPKLDNSHVDVEEATKILGTKSGLVVNIGKEISEFNRIDMGVFNLKSKSLLLIQELENEQEVFGWTDVVKKAMNKGLTVRYCDMSDHEWIDIDNYYDYRIALNILNEIIPNSPSD
jgi:CDP-L-myo-inositol myo-inositolphosphotransferase